MSGIGMSFEMVTTPSLGMSQTGQHDDKPAERAYGATSAKAVDDFLAYMKKSLAERMADAWLASQGLDRAQLKAMKPKERDAVLQRMAAELKLQLQQATETAKAARGAQAA
jgi:hypothetical protein